MFDRVHSGKLHDLPDFFLIIPFVALSLAFLAHWFGVMRALQSHGQPVGKKFCAIRAEGDLPLLDLFDII